MFKYLICLLLALCVHCCSGKSIHKRKVPTVKDGNIYPEVISCKLPVYSMFNGMNGDELLLISAVGTIHKGILNDGKIKNDMYKVHFELPCKDYLQSSDKTMLFGYGGRDFHAVDIGKKISKRLNVSFETNERILELSMMNEHEKKVLICLTHDGWNQDDSYCTFLTYNFNYNVIEDRSKDYQWGGLLTNIDDSMLLFQQWNEPPAPTKWWLSDRHSKELDSNRLNEKLNEIKMTTMYNTIDFKNRKMIGFVRGDRGREQFCYVKWKTNFEEPSVTPFTFQKPNNRGLTFKYEFSPDGKWIKSTSTGRKPDRNTWIMFYHCDDAYPGGLSIPVHGGDSHTDSKGVFLETKEYGTVYLDISRGMNGVIFMYKMSDVLEQICSRVKEMIE